MRIKFKAQIPSRPDGALYSGKGANGAAVGDTFEGTAEDLERLERDFPGCFEDATEEPQTPEPEPAPEKDKPKGDRQAKPRRR